MGKRKPTEALLKDDPVDAYLGQGDNVFISPFVEVGASAGEVDPVAADHHPVLVGLLGGQVSVGYVRLPHFVTARRPPDRNLGKDAEARPQ